MNIIAAYKTLKKIVAQRRSSVLCYMPQFAPRASEQIVGDMLRPGTMAHALVQSICLVIAEELARQDHLGRANDVSDWMGG